jgi:hypothetical protein
MLMTTDVLGNDVQLDSTALERVDDGTGTTKAAVKRHIIDRAKTKRGRR